MKYVHCKKNFIGSNETGSLSFLKGKDYECDDFIDCEAGKVILIYDLRHYNSHYFWGNNFSRYFYTEKELRKIKIKKLYESSL